MDKGRNGKPDLTNESSSKKGPGGTEGEHRYDMNGLTTETRSHGEELSTDKHRWTRMGEVRYPGTKCRAVPIPSGWSRSSVMPSAFFPTRSTIATTRRFILTGFLLSQSKYIRNINRAVQIAVPPRVAPIEHKTVSMTQMSPTLIPPMHSPSSKDSTQMQSTTPMATRTN